MPDFAKVTSSQNSRHGFSRDVQLSWYYTRFLTSFRLRACAENLERKPKGYLVQLGTRGSYARLSGKDRTKD